MTITGNKNIYNSAFFNAVESTYYFKSFEEALKSETSVMLAPKFLQKREYEKLKKKNRDATLKEFANIINHIETPTYDVLYDFIGFCLMTTKVYLGALWNDKIEISDTDYTLFGGKISFIVPGDGTINRISFDLKSRGDDRIVTVSVYTHRGDSENTQPVCSTKMEFVNSDCKVLTETEFMLVNTINTIVCDKIKEFLDIYYYKVASKTLYNKTAELIYAD